MPGKNRGTKKSSTMKKTKKNRGSKKKQIG